MRTLQLGCSASACVAGLLLLLQTCDLAHAADRAGKTDKAHRGERAHRVDKNDRAGQELAYPDEDFARLDTFEGLNLQDADKLYVKKDYKGAYAAYKAYSFEFAKSKALPYVLLRMGRCMHQMDKRNEAIKAYQDVVDYFPDDVRYAAAALYYIGQCHGQNGDTAKQTAVWARMVQDDDYVRQPNSGTALIYLGAAMEKLGKLEEATSYRWRTAVAFLESNPDASRAARDAVISHYVCRAPNHAKLMEFYTATNRFDSRGVKTGDPQEDALYWNTVLHVVMRGEGTQEQKETACRYWSGAMGDRLVDQDDVRVALFNVQLACEKDRKAWAERMEKQFNQKPASLDRVLQWCGYYGNGEAALRSEFYAKHGAPLVAALKNDEKMNLMKRLRDPLGMHDEAQAVMRTVRTDGMSDAELRTLAEFVACYEGEDAVLRYLAKIKEPIFAARARFDYYNQRSHRNKPYMEKALAEIPALQKSPQHAKDVGWAKGILLQGLGRLEEAIQAYRAANREPDSTWAVTDCLVSLKQYGEAIKTVQGLESVGGDVAARACMRVADIYRISGDKGREVQQLRTVLRRYPKSGESSAAHQRLEEYGVKIIGGEAKAEE